MSIIEKPVDNKYQNVTETEKYFAFLDKELETIGLRHWWYALEYGIPEIHYIGKREPVKRLKRLRKFFGLPDTKAVAYIAEIVSEPNFFNTEGFGVHKVDGLQISINDKKYKSQLEKIIKRFEAKFGESAKLVFN